MKKFNGFQIVFILYVSILLTYCTGGTEKIPKVDDTNQESTSGEEINYLAAELRGIKTASAFVSESFYIHPVCPVTEHRPV